MDKIQETLSGLVDVWRNVQEVKLQERVTKAQLSLQALDSAAYRQNAQAAAQSALYSPMAAPNALPLLLTAGLIAGAVVLIARRK